MEDKKKFYWERSKRRLDLDFAQEPELQITTVSRQIELDPLLVRAEIESALGSIDPAVELEVRDYLASDQLVVAMERLLHYFITEDHAYQKRSSQLELRRVCSYDNERMS